MSWIHCSQSNVNQWGLFYFPCLPCRARTGLFNTNIGFLTVNTFLKDRSDIILRKIALQTTECETIISDQSQSFSLAISSTTKVGVLCICVYSSKKSLYFPNLKTTNAYIPPQKIYSCKMSPMQCRPSYSPGYLSYKVINSTLYCSTE